MSDKPSQELSVEETLRRTFDLYSRNFIVLFVPMLIAMLMSGYFSWLFSDYIANIPLLNVDASYEEMWEWFNLYVPTILGGLFALVLASWAMSTVANGTIIKGASDSIEKGSSSLAKSFGSTVGRLPYLLVSGFVVAVLTALGLVALIVPGIIIALMWSLTAQAVIIENAGILHSMSRSRRLVSNRWLKTFVLLLVVGLLCAFVTFVGTLLASPFGDFGWVASNVVSSLAAPLAPIALTIHYYSMLAREQQQSVPPPPPPTF